MLKLLNTKTNVVFTLPDEEVMKIMKQDRVGEFRVLDAGFTVAEEPKKLPEKTVEELIVISDEKKKELEEQDNSDNQDLKEDLADITKMTKLELIGTCKRFGINANNKDNKETLINRIKEAGVL